MALDLNLFQNTKIITAPVMCGSTKHHKKRYTGIHVSDGWYDLQICGNDVMAAAPSYPTPLANTSGYVVDGLFIPNNFDAHRRKYKCIFNPINFCQIDIAAVSACIWEDQRLYYLDINYSDWAFDQFKESGPGKGITPEIRYALSLIEIRKQRLLMREMEELKKSRAGDVHPMIVNMYARAGGSVSSIQIDGIRATVTWNMPECDYVFNSVIDTETMMVVEAGYCMSGDDSRHNVTSLVKTAESYDERDLIYITRR